MHRSTMSQQCWASASGREADALGEMLYWFEMIPQIDDPPRTIAFGGYTVEIFPCVRAKAQAAAGCFAPQPAVGELMAHHQGHAARRVPQPGTVIEASSD